MSRCLSDEPAALAEWMAQYYLAPLGEVLRGMLPLMAEVRRTVYYRITDLGRDVLAEAWSWCARERLERMGHGARGLEQPTVSAGKLSPEEQDRRKQRVVLDALGCGRAGESLNAAHGYGGHSAVLASAGRARNGLPARLRPRSAMRAALTLCRADSGDAAAHADRKSSRHSGRAGGLRRRTAAGRVAERDLPSSTLQTLVRRGLVRIEERPAAFRLGGLAAGSCALPAE